MNLCVDSSSDNISEYDENKRDVLHLLQSLRTNTLKFPYSLDSSSPGTSHDCDDSSYNVTEQRKADKALELNIAIDRKLEELQKTFSENLAFCKEKLKEVQRKKIIFNTQTRQEHFRYVYCAKPYFKDKDLFPAPNNEDAIKMSQCHMINISDITSMPGWTVRDKKTFNKTILKMSQEIATAKLESQIASLHRQIKVPGTNERKKQLKQKIKEIQQDILNIPKKEMKDIVLPINEDYDWVRVAAELYRHSAIECESMWKLFLHPSLNKSGWKKEEHLKIRQIADQYKHQNWDAIASKLNTNRSGYQCFVYFRTNISNISLGQKWTQDEEQYLLRIIEHYKDGQHIYWGKVASCMGNRTKIQIYNKYFRLIEARKGRFIPEEDAVLLKCVSQFGHDYRKIKDFLPGRSISQLRIRFNTLSKTESTTWTIEEDKKLLKLAHNVDADDYSTIATYFPNKSRTNVRTRYKTLIKWMETNPGLNISRAPRRAQRSLRSLPQAEADLNTVLQKLQNKLHSQYSEVNMPVMNISETIDDVLTTFITNEIDTKFKKLEREHQHIVANNTKPVNVLNLKNNILLLKGELQEQAFRESSYFNKYPSLLEKQVAVKVKCYSKKSKVLVRDVGETPGLWGNNTLKSSDYVMPPNYLTMMALLRLMEYCNTVLGNTHFPFTMNALFNRDPLIMHQYYKCVERMHLLFLYPVLINSSSNHVVKFPRAITDTEIIESLDLEKQEENNISEGNVT